MSGRANPFGDEEPGQGLDLKGFTPRKPVARVKAEEIREVAEKASFQSREPAPTPPTPTASDSRLFRTGRNVQFSAKVTQELHDEIYSLSDALGQRMEREFPGMRWTLGMTVERMVAALKKEVGEV